jgi:predicted aspartyl protease
MSRGWPRRYHSSRASTGTLIARRSAAATGIAIAAAADVAAAAESGCKFVRIAEWPVRPGSGSPIVDGAINGQKVGILLDTGASTRLLRSAAIRLGLVRYTDTADRAVGIGGETVVETVSVGSFAIGNTVRRNWGMRVIGETDLGGDISALLGEDFFRQTDIEFDLAHNAVRLFQARDCDGVTLAYWTTERPGVIALDGFSAANPSLEFAVEINGKPVRALLDTGAFRSVLTKAQAEALGVTPDTAGVIAAGCTGGLGAKRVDAWIGPFESFAIGDELIRNPYLRFADVFRYSKFATTGGHVPRTVAHPDMLLGADFLRSHRVLVAYSQGRIYFTYAGGAVFPKPSQPGYGCDDAPRPAPEPTPATK